MKKLSEALNEIVRLQSKKRRLRRSEMERAFSKTLSGLDDILENNCLLEEAEKIQNNMDQSETSSIITDLRRFQDLFIAIENRELKRYEINSDARKIVAKKLRLLRKDIDSLVGANRPLSDMVEETRSIVIELLEALEQPDDNNKVKHNVERKLNRVLYIAAGATVVGINVGIFVANPVPSGISVAFGGALIGKAL